MSKPLALLASTLLLPALAVTACGDDSSVDGGGQAGMAGAAGSPPFDGGGGAADGGQAGARADGVAGDGGTAGASTSGGHAGDGLAGSGRGGGGGSRDDGGAGGGGTGTGGTGGAGGEGGGDDDEGCAGSSLPSRLCAAFEARACDEPIECVACAKQAREQRAPFATCPACAATFDSWQQCAVTAFEDGNVSEGVECVDGYAEVHGDNCASYLQAAIDCSLVQGTEGCPATWPQ